MIQVRHRVLLPPGLVKQIAKSKIGMTTLIIINVVTIGDSGYSIGDKQYPFTNIEVADPKASPLCIVHYKMPGLEINANPGISPRVDRSRNLVMDS
jgi:hypothetical protein